MDKHESSAKYNLAEVCSASISLADLQDLCEDESVPAITKSLFDPTTKLTYGTTRGSHALRSNLADLYSTKSPAPFGPENILITPGAIAANLIAIYALVGKGDHVICHYPTYQQLFTIPASLGAEVDLWRAKESDGWSLDIDELKALIKPNTKLIIIKSVHFPFKSSHPLPT